MAHYAFLNEDNIVTNVITGKDETDTSHDWEEYYAVDMNAYNDAMKSGIPIDTFLDAGYASSYTGENNGPNSTVYWVEESIDSEFFISDYTGMIFEERNPTNKDLELIGSFLEKKNL